MIWLLFPLFAVLWSYKGWSFWRSFVTTVSIGTIVGAFIQRGFFIGILVVVIMGATFWVYGDAAEKKVPYPTFYAMIVFLLPLVGFIIYMLLRNSLSQVEIQTIETENGRIEIRNDVSVRS